MNVNVAILPFLFILSFTLGLTLTRMRTFSGGPLPSILIRAGVVVQGPLV